MHVTYESQKQKPKENTVKRTVDSSLASQMERLQFPNAKTERYFVKYGINSGTSGIGLCIISQRKIKLKEDINSVETKKCVPRAYSIQKVEKFN